MNEDTWIGSGQLAHFVRIEGSRPTPAFKPEPGTYWIKVAECRYVHVDIPSNQPSDSYYTWDNYDSEWVIATWDEDEDYYSVVGSDEVFDWCNKHYVVIEVGPKLNPPE